MQHRAEQSSCVVVTEIQSHQHILNDVPDQRQQAAVWVSQHHCQHSWSLTNRTEILWNTFPGHNKHLQTNTQYSPGWWIPWMWVWFYWRNCLCGHVRHIIHSLIYMITIGVRLTVVLVLIYLLTLFHYICSSSSKDDLYCLAYFSFQLPPPFPLLNSPKNILCILTTKIMSPLPVDAGWASAGWAICHWAGSLSFHWSVPSERGSHRPYRCPTWSPALPGWSEVSLPRLSPAQGTVMSSTEDGSHAPGPEQSRRHPRVGYTAARCCCLAGGLWRWTMKQMRRQMKMGSLGASWHYRCWCHCWIWRGVWMDWAAAKREKCQMSLSCIFQTDLSVVLQCNVLFYRHKKSILRWQVWLLKTWTDNSIHKLNLQGYILFLWGETSSLQTAKPSF